jgi:uncharacterized Tic20 family protein
MRANEPYRLGSCTVTVLPAIGVGVAPNANSFAGGTQAMPQFGAPAAGAPAAGYAPGPHGAPQSAFTPPAGPGAYPGHGAGPAAYPGYAMAGPYDTLAPEARTFGMLCHIGALAGYVIPFGNLVGPLVFWLLKKDQHPFVDQQGKESLNFQITVTIAYVVFGTLSIFLVGIPFLIATGIAALILEIIAGVRANAGISYRYPFTLRLLT